MSCRAGSIAAGAAALQVVLVQLPSWLSCRQLRAAHAGEPGHAQPSSRRKTS